MIVGQVRFDKTSTISNGTDLVKSFRLIGQGLNLILHRACFQDPSSEVLENPAM